MKTTEHKLKQCPFCGCSAHFEKDELQWEWVACVSCGMQGNRRASCMDDCKPLLAEEWNRRARPEIRPLDTCKVVSDDELAKAFAGTNFGSADHRQELHVAVLKKASGYHCGHTITTIMRELRLIGVHGLPTKKGRRLISLAFHALMVGGP
nr:Lar family restriction alleviation protein [Comamonas thiooxydans]